MKDYILLGSAPSEEDCVQVSQDPNYIAAMYEECKRWKSSLMDKFPIPEGLNVHFGIKRFPHDFGEYMEVALYYDDRDEEAMDFAFEVENTMPERWDD